MKITRVERFRWPVAKPISNELHTYTHSGIGLVFVKTNKETTGIGLGREKGGVIGATIERMKELPAMRIRSRLNDCATRCGYRN